MSDFDLAHLRDLIDRATPGPWHHRQANKAGLDWLADTPNGEPHRKVILGRGSLYGGTPDYALVAAMRNALPLILAERAQMINSMGALLTQLESPRNGVVLECMGKPIPLIELLNSQAGIDAVHDVRTVYQTALKPKGEDDRG